MKTVGLVLYILMGFEHHGVWGLASVGDGNIAPVYITKEACEAESKKRNEPLGTYAGHKIPEHGEVRCFVLRGIAKETSPKSAGE